MNQSVITDTTKATLVAKLEAILDRNLAGMEETIIEYVLVQVRFGLVEIE